MAYAIESVLRVPRSAIQIPPPYPVCQPPLNLSGSNKKTASLTGTKVEAPRGSGDVAAGQLDVQVTTDVDLDELGQPHVVRHECEPLDQPVLGPLGQVNDTPPVQWSRFVAANRVLDVKQRLSRTGAKKVPSRDREVPLLR